MCIDKWIYMYTCRYTIIRLDIIRILAQIRTNVSVNIGLQTCTHKFAQTQQKKNTNTPRGRIKLCIDRHSQSCMLYKSRNACISTHVLHMHLHIIYNNTDKMIWTRVDIFQC